MTFLKPDKTIIERINTKDTIEIKQKIIPNGVRATKDLADWVKKGDLIKPNKPISGTGKPKGITIHNTNDIKTPSETNPAEQYARATYPNENMKGAVVHYWVYKTEIWQQLEDTERGWHAGDGSSRRIDHRGNKTGGNIDTIAIECIESKSDKTSEDTLAKLVAVLCIRHNLEPKYDVYTHNYWVHGKDETVIGARKNCPLYILDHWKEFLNNVQKYYDSIKQPTKDKESDKFKVGDIVYFKGNKHYTSSYKTAEAKSCKSGKAKVVKIVKKSSNQPYNVNLKYVDGSVSTVNGWVKDTDITSTETIKIGDKIKCKSGVTKYSDGKIMPTWVTKSILYVRAIEKNGTVYLVSTEKTKKVYTGRIKATDVEKI